MMSHAIGFVVSVFVVCSADRVFHVHVSRNCASGWVRIHDTCYLFEETQRPYNEAKIACTNYSARLMIPRSVEHLTAVMDLARDVEFVVDVLQFPGSAPKEGWILQDGTDLKDGPLWCDREPNDYDTLLAFDGRKYCLNDMSIHQHRYFVCERGLESGFTPNSATPVEYTALFDGNQTSCVDTDQILTSPEHYVIIALNVTESREGDVFTVVYSKAVSCKMQRVLYTKQDSLCSDTVTLKPCDWLPAESDISTSCQYKCTCTGNGCEVFLVDRRDKKGSTICEISLIDSLNQN